MPEGRFERNRPLSPDDSHQNHQLDARATGRASGKIGAILGLSTGFDASNEQILAVVHGLRGPEGGGAGKPQNSEPKFALPVTGTGEEWGAQGIRAEPAALAGRPREKNSA
jgi:hypothetical protein